VEVYIQYSTHYQSSDINNAHDQLHLLEATFGYYTLEYRRVPNTWLASVIISHDSLSRAGQTLRSVIGMERHFLFSYQYVSMTPHFLFSY
jgi:hypothetical protein